MTSFAGLAVEAFGGALVASAGLDAVRLTCRARPARGEGRRVLHRLLAAYDRSAGGRRLAGSLDAASINVTPARWRSIQAVAALPATLFLTTMSVPPGWSLPIAGLAVRIGARACLRCRRDRRDDELTMAATVLARHLATELASGSTAGEACTALLGTQEGAHGRRLDALIAAVLARAAVGEAMVPALYSSVAELPAGRGRDTLALLTTQLELVVDRGCGTAVLTRLASGIEERRQTVAEVRAATAEIRMATLAIPVMAVGIAGLLVLADASVASAAATPAGAIVGGALGTVAAAAVVVARRVTSPWEPA